MEIVSRSNNLVKRIKKLADKKARYEAGEYVAEGRRWVTDALARCPQDVLTVVRRADCAFEPADAVLSESLFNELSDTENSQGVLAIMRMPKPTQPQGERCLLLDRIRDPGNMGTILRTACAAGFTDVVLRDSVDVFNPKVIRSCMTGVLGLRFAPFSSVDALALQGYVLVGTALAGEDVFSALSFPQKICLVIGNEAEGVAPEILSACRKIVTIPMEDGVESLNAAVAAGILMYRIRYENN